MIRHGPARARGTPHRGQGESLVPPYTRGIASFPLDISSSFWRALPRGWGGDFDFDGREDRGGGGGDGGGGLRDGGERGGGGGGSGRGGVGPAHVRAGRRRHRPTGAYTRPLLSSP